MVAITVEITSSTRVGGQLKLVPLLVVVVKVVSYFGPTFAFAFAFIDGKREGTVCR